MVVVVILGGWGVPGVDGGWEENGRMLRLNGLGFTSSFWGKSREYLGAPVSLNIAGWIFFGGADGDDNDKI